MMKYQSLPYLILILHTILHKLCIASSIRSPSSRRPSPASSSKDDQDESKLFPFNKPNLFVSSSPLSVAAVCKNGVVLVALHLSPADSHEPLLLSSCSNGATAVTNVNHSDKKEEGERDDDVLSDLPMDTRGPLRIEALDPFGSALLCAGWRTDGMTLAEKGRDLSSGELQRYGGDVVGAHHQDVLNHHRQKGQCSMNYDLINYGPFIARGLSSFMASCASSSGTRSLSSVGLLATPVPSSHIHNTNRNTMGFGDGNTGGGGCLWLIDATGAYPCRAHAIGLGSEALNRQLMEEDFEQLSIDESAVRLLNIIKKELNCGSDAGDRREEEEDRDTPDFVLPVGTKVEIAAVDSEKRKMRRLRQAFFTEKIRN